MRISIVVAMTPDRIIGRNGQLPWHLPADLKHFRRITMGHPVVMGRRTYESIGKPLKGRVNIIVTRQSDYKKPGCHVVHTPEEALELAEQMTASSDPSGTEPEVMVIGGTSIYGAFLPQVQRMYITIVHARVYGDTWFPAFERDDWLERMRTDHDADPENVYPYSFTVLDRKSG